MQTYVVYKHESGHELCFRHAARRAMSNEKFKVIVREDKYGLNCIECNTEQFRVVTDD